MSAREDLIAAKALIDAPEKWKKSRGEDGPGTPCCMAVAVSRVHGLGTPAGNAALEALRDALPRGAGSGWFRASALGTYNDAPETTHADIMAVFDRAINSLESPK